MVQPSSTYTTTTPGNYKSRASLPACGTGRYRRLNDAGASLYSPGGQAGLVGHITIGNHVAIGAQAGVINNVSDGKVILGAPAIDAGQGKRAYGMIQYLPEMKQSIRELGAQ